MVDVAQATRPDVAPRPVRAIGARRVAALAATAALTVGVLATAKTGPEGRILVDRPVTEPHPQLWGVDHWMTIVQIATVIATSLFLAYFVMWSRRHARMHPALPVLGALFVMGLLTDSFANWTSSAAMNPALLHYPTDWWFFDVSPTVEPLVNTVAYPYLFLFPALAVVALVRRRAAAPRRPLLTVFALTYLVALPINFVLVNLFMVRIEYWTYTQIPGWAAVRDGTPWQYPWTDPLTLSVLTGVTAVLLWRDADGAGVATRFAGRIRGLRAHRVGGEIVVAVLITALAYVPYNALWASWRVTDSGDSLAEPWVFENTKVYDPKGDYARAGVDGPYFPGLWP